MCCMCLYVYVGGGGGELEDYLKLTNNLTVNNFRKLLNS